MSSFAAGDPGRHVYVLKAWQKILYGVMGVFFAAMGAFFVVGPARNHPGFALLIPVGFVAIGAYIVVTAARSRLVLEGSRVEVRGAWSEKSADLNQIAGFRTISTRNGSYVQLQLKDGAGAITIPTGLDTDDAYRAWMEQVPNLDEKGREEILNEIEQRQDLGATREERLAVLASAKTWAIVLGVITGAAAVGLAFAPDEALKVASAVVLGGAPFVAAYLVHRSPLLYAMFKSKSDPRAEVSYVPMIAGLGFLFSGAQLHFVSLQPLAPGMVLVGLLLAATLYAASQGSTSRGGTMFALLFFGGLYGFGLVRVADTLADHAPASHYMAAVIGKHYSSGRSTTYYLELAPWGPFESENSISVSSSTYQGTTSGDQVCLELHPGNLRAAWYKLIDCAGAPPQEMSQ